MSKLKKIGYPFLAFAFWILVWWGIAAAVGNVLLLPTPFQTVKKLFLLAGTAEFWKTVLLSLLRISAGIVAALAAGVVLAVLADRISVFEAILSPVLSLCKATPVAPVIFLLLLWVGRGAIPAVIAFVMTLPIVYGNVFAGIRETDVKLLEMARVFRVPRKKRIFGIVLPSVKPYFLAACRSSLAISWKAGVAAEVLCLPEYSIGKHIYEGKLYLLTEEMFAWTLAVVLLSVVIEKTAVRLLGGKAKKE